MKFVIHTFSSGKCYWEIASLNNNTCLCKSFLYKRVSDCRRSIKNLIVKFGQYGSDIPIEVKNYGRQ